MNYLAHLYLAEDHPDAHVGSLMGDFLKGAVPETLTPLMRYAVLQHRRVDTFTDQHPVFRRSKRRIQPAFRRYSGILIDMFYDHYLAAGWRVYSQESLQAFAQRIYHSVDTHPQPFPGHMLRAMAWMVQHNSLSAYASVEGIAHALKGIESRLRRPSQLGSAIMELERHYDQLQGDFSEFFAALLDFVDGDNRVNGLSSPGILSQRLGIT